MGKYEDLDVVKLSQLMDDVEAMVILDKYFGELIHQPLITMVKGQPVNTVLKMAKGRVTEEQIAAAVEELGQL